MDPLVIQLQINVVPEGNDGAGGIGQTSALDRSTRGPVVPVGWPLSETPRCRCWKPTAPEHDLDCPLRGVR
jgi:hypothetical protein